MRTRCQCPNISGLTSPCMSWILVLLALWLVQVQAMKEYEIRDLRLQTEHMFYHGYDNYIKYAFPEDELRPLSCGPLTRDRDHPERIELNDVLGNYSLTLIDSLSTLGILASSNDTGSRAWTHFENGVQELVRLYGDGTQGPSGQGERARGFDLDSKVQVFETVIRGLGGLLSAHLFAVGDLPIRGYSPPPEASDYARAWDKSAFSSEHSNGIVWSNGFVYNGQLLRLARDLADRLLPAFYTPTGLPYPRVNLRHGVPFFDNSPLSKTYADQEKDDRKSRTTRPSEQEITETCSAGAGSLVLEFTTLSRLTGDGRYEDLAKRAFWAVWLRRSDIDLIGAGIDAESGNWVGPYTGIGAGIDSFFEYAFKAYVLLSPGEPPEFDLNSPWSAMDDYFIPLEEAHHSPESYFQVWKDAQDAIKHHLYRSSGYQHPHYVQADLQTGATRAFWIDSLSAFYPGVLTLAGRIEEATEIHLLATALWSRFSALPERWNVATGDIDNGLGWWAGRPEFIESTYYLYRATKDPWYLHVGEMVLRDIKRRCWTRCGWAGLQDVRTGELQDRMESFFLGETTKYMFLLFNPDHPLNKLDAPFVFTTEGHPLIIPKSMSSASRSTTKHLDLEDIVTDICDAVPQTPPFSFSSTAARPDIFHAASLARLHLMPGRDETGGALLDFAHDHPSVTISDLFSPSNYTFFPWTLPTELVPHNATSSPMSTRPVLDLSFPKLPNMMIGLGSMERVRDGILLKSIGGLRLGMVQDMPLNSDGRSAEAYGDGFRIQVVNNIPLGKDEKVYISREILLDVLSPGDPNFFHLHDPVMLDVIIDVEPEIPKPKTNQTVPSSLHEQPDQPGQEQTVIREESLTFSSDDTIGEISRASSVKTALSALMSHVSAILLDEHDGDIDKKEYLSNIQSTLFQKKAPTTKANSVRLVLPAVNSVGAGSGPLPDVPDASVVSSNGKPSTAKLQWSKIYMADDLCDHRLPANVAREYQVLVIKRGGCSFSEKLRNIPGYPSSSGSNNNHLQLVILVTYPEHDAESRLSLYDDSGDHNHNVNNNKNYDNTYYDRYHSRAFTSTDPNQMQPRAALASESMLIRPHLDEIQVTSGGLTRRDPISVIMVGGGDETYEFLRNSTGLGIRRRWLVRSQDVPIGNLYIL